VIEIAAVTDRQLEALRFIHDMMQPRGPTIRELGRAMGVPSSQTAYAMAGRLIREGLAHQLPGSRGLVITAAGMQALGLKGQVMGWHTPTDLRPRSREMGEPS